MDRRSGLLLLSVLVGFSGCAQNARLPVSAGTGSDPTLPPPSQSLLPTVNVAPATGWRKGATPEAAPGLAVSLFAENLDHPRWIYVMPNGDVLVAETNAPAKAGKNGGIRSWIMKKMKKKAGAAVPSADRITLLRDSNGDGEVDLRTIFLDRLHSPFGMALVGKDLYVANTDAVMRFAYEADSTRIDGAGTPVVDLPAGPINRHWTRNIIANGDGSMLYVAVGSNSDHGENGMDSEKGRAAIWEVELPSGNHRLLAGGLRNPVGMAFESQSGALWTAVNERDELGGDLVPDFMTSVQDGGFYGWPYSYFGSHVDSRVKPQRPDLVDRAIVPDYALGPHTASLGLSYWDGNGLLPYPQGMFVGQHGSWNRKPHSGYKVIFIAFADGRPAGPPVDVLTGFLSADGKAMGRPVGVAIDKQGALLVADDVGNTVWRVTPADQDQ